MKRLSINKNLACFARQNQHLATELKKLPEINSHKNASACLALDNLLKIYNFDPDRFDQMFEKMDRIGLTAYRSYCTPLQALFWLVQDEHFGKAGSFLNISITHSTDALGNGYPTVHGDLEPSTDSNESSPSEPSYTLTKLLKSAWNGEALLILSTDLFQIIHRIQKEADIDEYALLVKRHNMRKLQGYIMDDFQTKKEIFDADDWAMIKRALSQSRWKLFYSVADRLNSPELISYYINKYIFFRKKQSSGVYFTFWNKNGQCTDAAYFAQFMLNRSGYKTFMRSVKWDNDPWDGLHTGSGIVLQDGSFLLVSNFTGINSISGPYTDIESLDQKLSCGKKIIDSRWGAYFPPRYY